jgi:L-iditol 2-dehydrogenase
VVNHRNRKGLDFVGGRFLRAAVIYGKEQLRVEEVETPLVGPNDVKVRVKACGICHYDLRFYKGSKQTKKPFVLGHECSGIVEETGPRVTEVKTRDRVAVYTDLPCGHCSYCIEGRTNLCSNRVYTDGGFAEFKVAPAGQVFKFSDSTGFDEACLTEPLACCLNSLLRGRIRAASKVVVVGAGPMGLLHVELARALGASNIIVVEPMAKRREKALELGADHAVDPATVNPAEDVMRLTDGFGADIAVVAVTSARAVEEGVKMVGKQGVAIVFAGFYPTEDLKIDANLIHYNEICITGSSDFPASLFPRALELVDSHRVQMKPLISHVFPIDRIEEGFKTAAGLQGLKVIITP